MLILIAACVLIILFVLFRRRSDEHGDTQCRVSRTEESQDETVTSIVTGSEWADRVPEDASIVPVNTTANELWFGAFEEMIC